MAGKDPEKVMHEYTVTLKFLTADPVGDIGHPDNWEWDELINPDGRDEIFLLDVRCNEREASDKSLAKKLDANFPGALARVVEFVEGLGYEMEEVN